MTPVRRRVALVAIKLVHTVAFAIIAAAGLLVVADGLLGRPRRRTAVALSIAVGECVVYAGNGFTCPLTPIARRLGDPTGSVSDIYLPDAVAGNLPVVGTTILVTGIALNAHALSGRRRSAIG
jgi:hypothetical protein